ncbi:hypothetical protein [Polynucleobacter difficilis]|uniref:hypothetical protein n=1 Tax=Polynucleobacter difficilis TaxID=556054 RepID=UPI00131F0C5B|nr:hypothetical protein [Polynucleobacter difficilis]
MMKFTPYFIKLLFLAIVLQTYPVSAQDGATQTVGLNEEIVSVDLNGDRKQVGVYTTSSSSKNPTRLAVLLPGYPSVVRPVVENGVMTNSRLSGNFLIRSRQFLVDETIASLIVDCQSDSGDLCSSTYQASKQRQEDVDKLIAEVKRRTPSISEVWLIGTSMGTISSSYMPIHNPSGYAGAIHTASITEPYARNSYRELGGFDYKKTTVPQYFVHHAADPCFLTTYAGAKSITDKYKVPLITVTGGGDFKGDACKAFTEHGFRGKEKDVMRNIGVIIKTGRADQLVIN